MYDAHRRSAACLLVVLALLLEMTAASRAAPPDGAPGAAVDVPPIVAGYQRLKDEAKATPTAQGEVLLGELNCFACHAAEGQQRVMTKGAPDLSKAGSRITPQYLRAYLSNPHGVKPGTTMPDIFHASEAQAKEGAVDFLMHYLVSLGGPIKPAREEANPVLLEAGRRLYHTIGCVACHEPEKPANAALPERGASDVRVPSVPLGTLASKTTVDELAAFLMDPIKVRPGSRMPSSNLTAGDATAIAIYLLRDQVDNPQSKDAPPAKVKGVRYSYFETNTHTADVDKLSGLKPKSEGRLDNFTLTIPGLREEDFAVRFTGVIEVPAKGRYAFRTLSDDGSRLYIDGNLVVNNDDVHAPTEKEGVVELTQGPHTITVTFFQGNGGTELKISWQGPGVPRQPIPAAVLSSTGGRPMTPLGTEPFAVDPQKAQMGQRMFAVLGCAACHTSNNVAPARPAKSVAALDLGADDGCLGDHVRKGIPQYHLSADQKSAMKAALKDPAALKKPLDPKELAVHTMAAVNCYACHKRDNVGGPTSDRTGFFVMASEFDMGDEGRIPPQLSGVGFKLLPDAIDQIVFESKLHIRPALATRMPRFEKAKLSGLVDAFTRADAPQDQKLPPKFSEQAAKDGRTLFGTKGLGCVNCHGVLGNKSLGMPAPDLTTVHERLRHPWYSLLLHDPNAVNPGTRMPAFWAGGAVAYKDIADGTVDGQIDALWAYLSLGTSMALPAGLQPTAGSELIAADEPIVHRTFMADVGSRAVLVGYPEQINLAFDANRVRLAKIWRGRFFDTKGQWEGRGGQALGPLGTDILDLPPGPAFAVLASPGDAWPMLQGGESRNLGGKFQGYTLDKNGRPTFRYQLDGVEIQEQPIPILQPGGAQLRRHLEITGKPAAAGRLYFQAAAGKKIESKAPGTWTIDDKTTIRLVPGKAGEKLEPAVRDGPGGVKQLIVPIGGESGSGSFDVEVQW